MACGVSNAVNAKETAARLAKRDDYSPERVTSSSVRTTMVRHAQKRIKTEKEVQELIKFCP